jgi:hypothetical protein
MHINRTAGPYRLLLDHRRLSLDRRRLMLAAAVAVLAAGGLLAAPWLALLAAVEWKVAANRQGRRRLLTVAAAGLWWRTVVWLWRELHGAPHRPWYPCAQCGRPIELPSRAACCSHACRMYARLRREAEANGRVAGRARRRLRAIELRRLADQQPEWTQVPF